MKQKKKLIVGIGMVELFGGTNHDTWNSLYPDFFLRTAKLYYSPSALPARNAEAC